MSLVFIHLDEVVDFALIKIMKGNVGSFHTIVAEYHFQIEGKVVCLRAYVRNDLYFKMTGSNILQYTVYSNTYIVHSNVIGINYSLKILRIRKVRLLRLRYWCR